MRDLPNELVTCLNGVLGNRGFNRRGSTWTRRHEEVTLVANLQKSPHSRVYYVNLGVFIHGLSDDARPRIDCCQIFARLDMLVGEGTPSNRLAMPLEGPNRERAGALLDRLVRTPNSVNLGTTELDALDAFLKSRPRIDSALDFDDNTISDEERATILTKALETVGLPFLENCDTVEKICQRLNNGSIGTEVVWGAVHDLCQSRSKSR